MTTNDIDEYQCSECGHRAGKWMGFCYQCRTPGSLERVAEARAASAKVMPLGSVARVEGDRCSTGIDELDRTLGGGLVAGASVVVGGEPGVGKSTLLLQVAGALAERGRRSLVVSAEESPEQVALRASRVSGSYDQVDVVATNNVDEIVAVAERLRPALVVVDSIQTISTDAIEGVPGGVGQVRECGSRLVAFAKRSGVPVVMIGHVTKDGTLAGPRLLEHLVDAVLYLEGDAHSGLRFVRGLKNRFGATPALGFFEMSDGGLRQLADPAGVLVGHGDSDAPGKVLFPAIEGRRPVVVEVQALVAPTRSAQPRRSVKGVEIARLHQVLAVLERHAGLSLTASDVYVASVGGIRLREPAADLAVALAVASSSTGVPLGSTAAWGEVGLTGELRAVGGDEVRTVEVSRLDVQSVIRPGRGTGRLVEALLSAGLDSGGRARRAPAARDDAL